MIIIIAIIKRSGNIAECAFEALISKLMSSFHHAKMIYSRQFHTRQNGKQNIRTYIRDILHKRKMFTANNIARDRIVIIFQCYETPHRRCVDVINNKQQQRALYKNITIY